jgi:hypothetical protein
MFDNLNTQFSNGGYSCYSNLDGAIYGYEYNTMNAYLNMFEATNDIKYLNEFAIHAKRVMDRRDDFISNANPVIINSSNSNYSCSNNYWFQNGIIYYSCSSTGNVASVPSTMTATAYPSWSRPQCDQSCSLSPYPVFMESGSITFPMARFVLLMKSSNAASESLPTEINGAMGATNYGSSSVTTFGQMADWLKARVYETINWEVNNDLIQNSPARHFESFFSSGTGGGWKSINQQCAIGRTMILMYYIGYLDGSTNNTYRDIIEDIAYLLYGDIHNSSNATSPINGQPWYTWCHAYDCSNEPTIQQPLIEDISHAWLDEEFAELYMQYFHPVSGYGRFDITDMQKFANGESNVIISSPRNTEMDVFGTSTQYYCNQMCDGNSTAHQYVSLFYTFLNQYNADVYQQIADFFLPGNTHETSEPYETLLAYSTLCKYQHIFNPIAAETNTWHNSHWAGCTAGNFAAGQSNTFATVRNKEGAVEIYSIANSHTFNQVASVVNHGVGWSGVTAMDLDGDGIDEIFALHNTDNAIYVYQQQGNTLAQIKAFTLIGSQYVGIASGIFNGAKTVVAISSNGYISTLTHGIGNYALHGNYAVPVQGAKGIAIGKFDNTGNDEIATINNSNGYVDVWNYNTATHSFTNVYQFTAAAGTYNQWNGICAGDYDGDGQDEIMAHRDYDGDFYIYKVKGGALVNDEKESFPTDQQNGVMCSINLPDLAPNTALLTLRNYDGNMVAFSMEGKCQNLHVSNQTISESTSLDNIYTPVYNNYPIDYHVSNTLSAGTGYDIQSPAKVDFIAGKLVDLKPGFSAQAGSNFHAWIEPAIACADPNLRIGSHHKPQHTQYDNMAKIVENNQPILYQKKNELLAVNQSFNTDVSVFPNPFEEKTELRFYLSAAETNVQIALYNMLGEQVKIIENTASLTVGIHQYDINRQNLPSGIYQLQLKTNNGVINKQVVIQ